MKIQKILMAYDFSVSSTRALDGAIQLSRAVGARLELLHIVPYDDVTQLVKLIPHLDEIETHIHQNVEKEFQKILGEYRGHNITTHVEIGRPAQEIVAFAESGGFDLLIVGTHSRGGLARFFLGSVAERVLRHAKLPVLVDRGLEPARVKRILVPVDLSEASEAALLQAREWAKLFGAEIKVLHVLGEYYYLPVYIQDDLSAYGGLVGKYEEKEKEAIAAWIARITGDEPAPAFECVSGPDAALMILERAKADSADLIVLGTHGRTGISHLLLGSVAEKVARYAPCSVLTAH